jgi:hypothetical protein
LARSRSLANVGGCFTEQTIRPTRETVAMSEPLFLLMFRVDGPPDAPTAWAAAKVEGIGCRLTREQAEALAAQTSHERRFLVPVNAETERFAGIDGPRYPMVIPPGQTIWVWGEPLRVDMLAVLLDVADGAESPTPDTVLLPVAAVVDAALNAFEPTDAHEVETAFDRLVMELGGRREGEPPAYHVSFTKLLGG